MDILAISCDSFDEEVNVLIGRGQGKKNHVENLQKLRKWCKDYRVAFKINSVINRFNVDEDMNEQIKALNPVRWKVSALRLLAELGACRRPFSVTRERASLASSPLGPQSLPAPRLPAQRGSLSL